MLLTSVHELEIELKHRRQYSYDLETHLEELRFVAPRAMLMSSAVLRRFEFLSNRPRLSESLSKTIVAAIGHREKDWTYLGEVHGPVCQDLLIAIGRNDLSYE